MKDLFLFSLIAFLCTACAASSVKSSPGFNNSDSGYVDLESSLLAESPIRPQVPTLACAYASPGGIYRVKEREEERKAVEEGLTVHAQIILFTR